jgi:hypothetical protein
MHRRPAGRLILENNITDKISMPIPVTLLNLDVIKIDSNWENETNLRNRQLPHDT